MSKPEGLVFDLDGTLLNTLASLAGAFNRALKLRNHPTHPVTDYRHIIGDGARTAVSRALPPGDRNELEINHCLELFRQYYAQSWQDATVYEGVIETLERLDADLPVAVLSNKDNEFTQQCVEHFFPGKFTLAIGASDSIKHKPHPSGAVRIADYLGTTTEQLWMIGDTSTDMQTAQQSGMTGIGVLWGFRDRDELANHGARHIIESPPELLGLLKRQ